MKLKILTTIAILQIASLAAAFTGPTDVVLLAKDSASGNVGFATNATYTPGRINNSVWFNGNEARITIPTTPILSDNPTSVGVSFWVFFDSNLPTANDRIWHRVGASSTHNGGCALTSSNSISCFWASNGITTSVTAGPSGALSMDTWYHVFFYITPTTVQAWRDGVPGSTGSLLTGMDTTTRNLVIGGWQSTGLEFMNGSVDEFRWYVNRTFTEADIDSIINGTETGTDTRTELHGWWRFDEEWIWPDPVACYTITTDGRLATVNATCSTSIPPFPLTYSWQFGDSLTGTGAQTTHLYAAPGTYLLNLTVTEATTTKTDTVQMTVNITDQDIQIFNIATVPNDFELLIGIAILIIAGVGISFISKTNPIPPIIGIAIEIISGYVTIANETKFTTDIFVLLLFAIGVTIILLAWRLLAISTKTKNEEE